MTQNMTQEELRELYKERLKREKQTFISQATNINATTLSSFKHGKIDLYSYYFKRLKEYLEKE